jgi:hypothetical protein
MQHGNCKWLVQNLLNIQKTTKENKLLLLFFVINRKIRSCETIFLPVLPELTGENGWDLAGGPNRRG